MTTLSRVGEIVRTYDPDRFLTTLFAPAAKRQTLWTLYAFNNELVRARETVREPMMALIRLQWWREVVQGERRRHEVAEPLAAALGEGALQPAHLLAIIEGREAEPPDTEQGWIEFVRNTAGPLAVAAGHALGATQVDAIRAAGAAYGAAGLWRNRALSGAPNVDFLANAGRAWLAEARSGFIPRPVLAAALPAVLAARDLRRTAPVRYRGAGDKLAVVLSAAVGRV